MPISADSLRRLAALNLSGESLKVILEVLADAMEPTKDTLRKRAIGSNWAECRQAVFDRDGFVCAYCKTAEGPFEIDHIFPVVRGGESNLDNLCVACGPCNRSKGGRSPQEWRGQKA